MAIRAKRFNTTATITTRSTTTVVKKNTNDINLNCNYKKITIIREMNDPERIIFPPTLLSCELSSSVFFF